MMNLILDSTNEEIGRRLSKIPQENKQAIVPSRNDDDRNTHGDRSSLHRGYAKIWARGYRRIMVRKIWNNNFSCSNSRKTFQLDFYRASDLTVRKTRDTRRYTDNLAPVRELQDSFIRNCQRYYRPITNLAVDEQLLGFRGNCPFRVYIPSNMD